jgi:hypothetical protein
MVVIVDNARTHSAKKYDINKMNKAKDTSCPYDTLEWTEENGEIKSIKMFSYENKALITFKNYTKCDDVMSQSHIVCENTVKLEKYYGPIEDEYFREEDEIESSDSDSDIEDNKGKGLSDSENEEDDEPVALQGYKDVDANLRDIDEIEKVFYSEIDYELLNSNMLYEGNAELVQFMQILSTRFFENKFESDLAKEDLDEAEKKKK